MKKTIAILLVLVLAGVGLFAATDTANLKIFSEVPQYNAIKITTSSYTFDDPFSYSDFYDSTDEVVDSTVVIGSTNYDADVTVGYLNYFTNSGISFATTVSATPLADAENASNLSKIGYYVTLTFNSTTTQVVSVDKEDSSATGSPYSFPVSTNSVSTGSSPIVVNVEDNDYLTALASDDYQATITFTYTTT